jgi:hypothetical protein
MTTLSGSSEYDILGAAALVVLWGGLILNGFWTGGMLIIFWNVRSYGRSRANRTDDPSMFWILVVVYSLFALLSSYFLVRALLG